MSECMHVWEWNVPPEALACKKCGEYLDCDNIVCHINTLEAENAELTAHIEKRRKADEDMRLKGLKAIHKLEEERKRLQAEDEE